MNILILSNKLPYPPIDGGAIATLNLAYGLAETGNRITLLAVNTKKHFFPVDRIPAEISSVMNFEAVTVDTSIRPVKLLLNLLFSSRPYIAQRFINKKFSKRLIQLLENDTFDIVQIEGPYMGYYIPIIRKYSSARIALRAHNLEHEIWKRKWMNEKNPLKKRYIRNLSHRIKKLEIWVLNSVDMLVAISHRDEELLKKLSPGIKSVTIPTGFNCTDYHPSPIPDTKDIFFIGALDWGPNQEGLQWFLKEVFHLLLKENPNLGFHIAGRNASDTFISKIAHPAITFHGEVENASQFMAEHMIMTVPLLSGSGIRIKILEGMALGKCIVTSSIGAEGIPAIDGKHLLIANDSVTFARKLSEAINNKKLVKDIAANARKLVQENFDTFAVASRLGDAYKEIL